MAQAQLYLDRQKLETKQSVVNSLGMFLAIAEGYLIKRGINLKPLFGYYDHFNITREYPEMIRIKLLNNYHIFIAQKQNYINKFRSYDFYPDNLPIEEIKKLLEKYVTYAKHIGEEDLYRNILSIFTEDEIHKYKSYYSEITKSANGVSNKNTHPIIQVNAIGAIYGYKEDEFKRNEEKWTNQEYPTINIIIGGEAGSSELSKRINYINDLDEKETAKKYSEGAEISYMIDDLINNIKNFINIKVKDQKNNLKESIKEKTQNLENEVNKCKDKYKDLECLWTILKPEDLEKKLKKCKSELKNDNKVLIDNIHNIFFENTKNDDAMDEDDK